MQLTDEQILETLTDIVKADSGDESATIQSIPEDLIPTILRFSREIIKASAQKNQSIDNDLIDQAYIYLREEVGKDAARKVLSILHGG